MCVDYIFNEIKSFNPVYLSCQILFLFLFGIFRRTLGIQIQKLKIVQFFFFYTFIFRDSII